MSSTPIADAIDGHQPQPQPRHAPPPQGNPVAALHAAALTLHANPLITAITSHPGMGQNLTDRDIDTVMRVIASIEAAHAGQDGM